MIWDQPERLTCRTTGSMYCSATFSKELAFSSFLVARLARAGLSSLRQEAVQSSPFQVLLGGLGGST